MFDDNFQMARDRLDEHEDYLAEQTMLRSLATRRSLSLSGTALLLLLSLLAFFFASGCTQALAVEQVPVDPDAIAMAELVGSYRIYDTGYPSTIAFEGDGSFRRATSANSLTTEPLDYGSWRIEGEELVLTSADTVANCGAGRTGRYRLSQYPRGGILFERLEEACEARVGFVPTAEMHPLQPAGLFCSLDADVVCAQD